MYKTNKKILRENAPLAKASVVLFAIIVVSSVFSVEVYLGGVYVDGPIEVIALFSMFFVPLAWRRDLLLPFFLAVVLFSGLLASTHLPAIRYICLSVLGFYFLPYLYFRIVDDLSLLRLIYSVVAVALSIYVLSTDYIRSGLWQESPLHPFSGSIHAFAYFLSMVFILRLDAFNNVRQIIVSVVVMVLVIAAILDLGSRSAFYSLILVVFVRALITHRKSIFPIFAVAAMSVLAISVLEFIKPDFYFHLKRRFYESNPFETVSFTSRVDSWKNYVDTAFQKPLGVGFESSHFLFFEGSLARVDITTAGAHNEFLKLLVELGWGGFVLYALLWLVSVRKGLATSLSPRVLSNNRTLVLMLLCTSIQFFTNNQMQHPEVALTFWLIMGLMHSTPSSRR